MPPYSYNEYSLDISRNNPTDHNSNSRRPRRSESLVVSGRILEQIREEIDRQILNTLMIINSNGFTRDLSIQEFEREISNLTTPILVGTSLEEEFFSQEDGGLV